MSQMVHYFLTNSIFLFFLCYLLITVPILGIVIIHEHEKTCDEKQSVTATSENGKNCDKIEPCSEPESN